MANRPITVVMKMWAKDGLDQEVADTFKYMMDIVIQEPTCRLLKVQRSLQDESHYILYEEWDDHDEFFNVQLKRDYRRGFAERMHALTAQPSQMEIFEQIYQA